MDNGAFCKTPTLFFFFSALRQHNNHILEMQAQCPISANCWAYFKRILFFMLKNRRLLDQ
ncbi:hypothetical protein CCR75_006517 [Bremia lactucae]|uniref:Uncharacterized protein n=1 Tax=Bremia lactucae TaxID=4779 RepID=A0A976IG40_BRELC|nr:hypothetical protein CCR75_006517 [Bremia lactucae]